MTSGSAAVAGATRERVPRGTQVARRQRGHRKATVALTVGGFAIGLSMILPYVVILIVALTQRRELVSTPTHIIPHEIAWSNFWTPWRLYPIARYFANSLIIAGGATIVGLAVAMPAGYAVARMKFRLRNGYLLLLLITQMLPPIMLVVGIYQEFRMFNVLNNLAALVLMNAAFAFAFSVFILADVFATIPEEIEEAAWMDGASRLRTLAQVVVPIAGPGIATAAIFIFSTAWNEFSIALTVLNQPGLTPVSVGLWNFYGAYDVQWPFLFATALMATVPVVVFFIVIERRLVSGLTGGFGK